MSALLFEPDSESDRIVLKRESEDKVNCEVNGCFAFRILENIDIPDVCDRAIRAINLFTR